MIGNNTISHAGAFEWQSFKEELKDDSRSGKPSRSRTGINIDWVKQIVCGDRQLTGRKLIVS